MSRSVVRSIVLFLFVLGVPVTGKEPLGVAGEISTLLAPGDRSVFTKASTLWNRHEGEILCDDNACLAVADAFADFGSSKQILLHTKILDKCIYVAEKCLDSAEGRIEDPSPAVRLRMGHVLLQIAAMHRGAGHDDLASKSEDRALPHLEAAAAAEDPGVGACLELGRIHVLLAGRDPEQAEEHLARAAECFERARKMEGKSAVLQLRLGEMYVARADRGQAALAADPGDRKLSKALLAAYKEAMACFEDGLKIKGAGSELRTAYNECLWRYRRASKRKVKFDPVLKEYPTRFKRLYLRLPDSDYWHVTGTDQLADMELFRAAKILESGTQGIFVSIQEFHWHQVFTDDETNVSVGGDNVRGLARMRERDNSRVFKEVLERRPLAKVPLSRALPRVESYTIRGATDQTELAEFRAFYVKHTRKQRTCEVLFVTDLKRMGEDPPELEEILSSLRLGD